MLQNVIKTLIELKLFEFFMLICISSFCIIISLEGIISDDLDFSLNILFTIIFGIELVLKIIANGFKGYN